MRHSDLVLVSDLIMMFGLTFAVVFLFWGLGCLCRDILQWRLWGWAWQRLISLFGHVKNLSTTQFLLLVFITLAATWGAADIYLRVKRDHDWKCVTLHLRPGCTIN